MPHFEEYRQYPDPDRWERTSNWRMTIGLQAVDGLTTLDYLIETARKHIEGEIAMGEVYALIHNYYDTKKSKT